MFFNCTLQAVWKLIKTSYYQYDIRAGVCLLVTFIHVQANAGMKAHAMKFYLMAITVVKPAVPV